MPHKILGSLWLALPQSVRLRVVRLTQPTFTASAAAVVLNEKREVLLLNHILRPAKGWGLPGGFLAASEQPADAVRRELREETGIELDDLKMLLVRTFGSNIEVLFSAVAVGTPRVLSREISGLAWFSAGSLPEGLPQSQKHVIEGVLAGEV